MEIMDSLQATQLFQSLSRETLADIADVCALLELGPGEILISEDARHDPALYVLCRGDVEVLSNRSGIISGEVVLSRRDVEVFGEVSWLLGGGRTATVRCVNEVLAIRIDGQVLMAYLEQNPASGFEIMRRIACQTAQRLKSTDVLLKQLLWNGEV